MYDFDTKINRRHSLSIKWNVGRNELPMWVGDMDFMTAPEIRETILKRAGEGVYGYSFVPSGWYYAYIEWWERYHDFSFNKECLTFCSGVVPAVTSAVREFTSPGDYVLVMTPAYEIFFHSILNNGRNVLENRLLYEDGAYSIDFEKLERDLSHKQTTMMIFCNPHNPTGKIWDRETIEKIGALCEKYNVTVFSDEIHCDLVAPGLSYVPFASVSDACREVSITALSPSKAFNLAGLQSAAVVIFNEAMRNRMRKALNNDESAEPNVFAVDAAVAAFMKGREWLEELLRYLQSNKEAVVAYLASSLPELSVVSTDATYFLWIDCADVTFDSSDLADFIRSSTGLYLSKGSVFRGNGNTFLRMNVACTRETLMDGLSRLEDGIYLYRGD